MQVDGVPNSICFNHPFRVRNPDLPTFFFDVPGPAQKLKDEKEADRQRRVLWLYGELINPRTKRAPIIINIYIYSDYNPFPLILPPLPQIINVSGSFYY
jgi:hypothetical protein